MADSASAKLDVASASRKSRTHDAVILGFSIGSIIVGAMIAVCTVMLALVDAHIVGPPPPSIYTDDLYILSYSLMWLASGIVGLVFRKRSWTRWVLAAPFVVSVLLGIYVLVWLANAYVGFNRH
jgi:hypothetical protein